MEVFTTKMELVHPTKKYGDIWKNLNEPLIILTDTQPFTTDGMQIISIIKPGTHHDSRKRTRQMIKDGLLPALQSAFGIEPPMFPSCYRPWHTFIAECLQFRLNR